MIIIKSFLLFFYSIQFLTWNVGAAEGRDGTNGVGGQTFIPVRIGVVLDLNSTMGTMADVCISMAFEDFYSVHSDYQTRLFHQTKDAREELDVVTDVVELLKNEDVHGILGPQTLIEDTFAAEIGRKAQVPLISFTSRSQSLSHAKNPYFIRTTPDYSNQVKALAAICKRFEWHEVVILYENTCCGSQFTSELNREFLMVDIGLASMIAVSASAADHHIKKELENLMTIQTRVYIVHMNAVLGGRLFVLAKRAGMISEGYAWLVTDSLGNFLSSIDSTAFDSMEGVLGVRPHVPKSEKLESFIERWKKNMILTKSASSKAELNVYGLWVYDTVWALAMAVEKIRPVNTSFLKLNNGENGSDIANLRLSQFGPKLLSELSNTSFVGLGGEFQLIDGQLKSSALEIFNVIGTGDRIIGYWTPDGGITGKLASTGDTTYSTSTNELKSIVWPGDSVKKPLGWSIPTSGKLKIGIPSKSGFTEFVNVRTDPVTNKINATGFCIDIFLSTLQLLPFKVEPEFIPFDPEGITYSDLIYSLPNKSFDIMVGDTTILADRARSVDFSLPYSESGVVWVVKDKQEKNMWIFIKPFRWDLWVTILATCIFIGVVLRILEHQAHQNSDSVRPHRQQLGMLFWFPIAVLAFPERNMVAKNWSRFVLVVWLFMSYILMQSYTANLSAMFTVDQLDFTYSQDYYIGYQVGSFVREFLINRLHISESKLRNYSSIEEYDDAMTKGGKNGGIDAIVDEIPYMKLLLNRYGSKYKMLGQRYRTDGFGFAQRLSAIVIVVSVFAILDYHIDKTAKQSRVQSYKKAFPKESRLVVYFSRAILEVTEGPNMTWIEDKNFGPGYSSENQLDSINKQTSLTAYNFGGLFIIIGSAMVFALFCSVPSVGPKLVGLATVFLKCFSFLPFGGNDFRTNSMVHPGDSKESSSEEVQMSEQINGNDSAMPDRDHQSGQGNSDVSAEASESDQNNVTDEIQQPEPGNIDAPSR